MMNHISGTTNTGELAAGVLVETRVRVESPGHVAELLGDASAAGSTVIPYGGRRSLATGNLMEPSRYGLDMTGLNGVLSYEPADLTLSVLAGTTWAAIQHVLEQSGQEVPIDVPSPEATTIGGLVATGFAGPRRLRSGSLRDLLIGSEFVRGDGLLAKAGGMVVKNVSGFEIPRFLHGSWGALAVLTSVNLKVVPVARAEGTLLAEFLDMDSAIEAAHRLITSEPSIEACVVTSDREGVRVAARAMGRAEAVSSMLDSFEQRLGSLVARLESEESRTYWQDLVDHYAEGSWPVVIAMSTRPRDIQALMSHVAPIGVGGGARIQVSPGTGSVRIAIPDEQGRPADSVAEIVAVANRHQAPYVLESAPATVRSSVATWGFDPEGLDVMRSVKQQFDPANVLNRGRLFV